MAITTCTNCAHYAKRNNQPLPVFEAREINQDTGLCWDVCDMEREANELEFDEWSAYQD
jgi:hypothetical protein